MFGRILKCIFFLRRPNGGTARSIILPPTVLLSNNTYGETILITSCSLANGGKSCKNRQENSSCFSFSLPGSESEVLGDPLFPLFSESDFVGDRSWREGKDCSLSGLNESIAWTNSSSVTLSITTRCFLNTALLRMNALGLLSFFPLA